MRWLLLAAALMLAATALAGCGSPPKDGSGNGTGSGTSGTGTATGTDTSKSGTAGTATTTRSSGTGTSTGADAAHSVDLTATAVTGTAPLNITFGMKAADNVKSWRLSFGDGSNALTGTSAPPATASHTYSVGGNFTAIFDVTFQDKKTGQDTVAIKVTVPDAGPPPPTHFDLGPAGGCDNSVTPVPCVSFKLGPSQTQAIDGFWIPLDKRYWGKGLTSTIEPALPGDSDCVFVAADTTTVIGEASNSNQTCEGQVPGNAAWLFIYSYVAPEQAMTVDFAL